MELLVLLLLHPLLVLLEDVIQLLEQLLIVLDSAGLVAEGAGRSALSNREGQRPVLLPVAGLEWSCASEGRLHEPRARRLLLVRILLCALAV